MGPPALAQDPGPQRELIDALYARAGTALAVVVINSTFLFAAFWAVAPHHLLLGWLALTWSVTAFRVLLTQTYSKSGRERRSPAHWARLWTLSASASGLLWGSTGVLLYARGSVPHQMLLLLLLAGMVAGASASASSHLPAFVAFTAPALLPIALRLAADGDRLHIALAALVLVFGAAMFAVARAGGQALRESAELRQDNASLIEGLRQARERLSDANLELEERVENRTHELREVLERREQLVAVVSHELRTPLTSLRLNQHLLEAEVRRSTERPIDAEVIGQVAQVMSKQLRRMSRMVEEMLVATHLSLSGLHYHFESVQVSKVVADALEPLSGQVAEAGVALATDVEAGLTACWDPYRIEQVIVNLVSNALKYGEGAPIQVRARAEGEIGVLEVIDQGPGIPPEHLERIFKPFERANSSEAVTGLGLGLYITEQIVKAHGGEVRVTSALKAGTVFTARIPLSRSQAGEAPQR